jgi:RNA polymerase sigma-70 factor (ECF subfamily)
MKGRYREDFKVALQAAMAGLSARDRTVLRLHWVDGLNIDKIGAVYRVHRSTVARWIAQCRKQLLEDTKRALKARLQVSHSELHSLVGLLRSQLHLSVSRVLQEEH